MASTLKGVVLTLDGTTQSVATALANVLKGNKFVQALAIIPYASNANVVLIGKSTMTDADSALGSIAVGSPGFSLSVGSGFLDISDLYVKGTNAQKVYINVVA